jgi:hypothetical protein
VRAARLFGAAMALRELIGTPQPIAERMDLEGCVASVRTALGEEACERTGRRSIRGAGLHIGG